MSNRLFQFIFILFFVAIGYCVYGTETPISELEELKPLDVHSRISKQVVDAVRYHHVTKRMRLDDEISSQVFDRYLDELDPRRLFLLSSDIEHFEQYRESFDDFLKKGDLSVGFEMFNLARKRQYERYGWVLERLSGGLESFDLTTDGVIRDRSEGADWLVDAAAAEDLWEKILVDSIIRLKLSDSEEEDLMETLEKRYTQLERRRVQTNAEDAFSTYMNAYTTTFDPHTTYLAPRAQENFEINMSLSLQGIGAMLRMEDDYVVVESLIEGGPAQRHGGVFEEDRIVGVGQVEDGPLIDVIGWRLDDVVDMIRGPKGATVYLELLDKDDKARVVAVVRDEVPLHESAAQKKLITMETDTPTGEQVVRYVGVIDLPSMYSDFAAQQRGDKDYRSATRDVSKLIQELKEEGMDGLIIDLRGNGGGSLLEAQKLTGLFIDTGPTVLVKSSQRRTDILHDQERGVAWDGPLAVVVDRRSASASEIFAGAIQDYGRGVIVGNRSFGKGTVQQLLGLQPHGQLKVTQSKFYRVSGQSTQHKGVVPDISFPNLFDETRIGESSLEDALAYSIIDGPEYFPVADISPLIPKLIERHQLRTDENPDFIYYRAVEDRIREDRRRNEFSLNEEKRRAEKEQRDAQRLSIENARLTAKGKDPVENLEDLLDALDDLRKETEDDPDGILIETAHVVSDLLELESNTGAEETSSL